MWDDDPYDHIYDEIYRDPPEDLRLKIVDEFAAERLRSYYEEQPFIMDEAVAALREAKRLTAEHPAASIVFAVAAIDICVKEALVRPMLLGLFHTEHPRLADIADLLARVLFARRGPKRAFLAIVNEFGG